VEMVLIPAGTFIMGSPNGTGGTVSEPNRQTNETQHSVTLTSGFYMGKYPVTQKQFKDVVGAATTGSDPSNFKGDNRPVEQVTWYDAVEFCNLLSAAEGLQPVYAITSRSPAAGHPITAATVAADFSKNGYRLPTEAEWEYSCRGDYPNKADETATLPFGIGDGDKLTSDMANFNTRYPYALPVGQSDLGAPDGNNKNATTVVGDYDIANNYGLYDMHGNVYEWCWDWYNAYSNSFDTRTNAAAGVNEDPAGASSGSLRVFRGGSWDDNARSARSACRLNNDPYFRYTALGFRLLRP